MPGIGSSRSPHTSITIAWSARSSAAASSRQKSRVRVYRCGWKHTTTRPSPTPVSRRESVGDLSRMVCIVVVDPNAVDCAHQLEAPIGTAILRQLNPNHLVRNAQPGTDGIAGGGVADVVITGH